MQSCGVLVVVESCVLLPGNCRENGGWLQAVYGYIGLLVSGPLCTRLRAEESALANAAWAAGCGSGTSSIRGDSQGHLLVQAGLCTSPLVLVHSVSVLLQTRCFPR